jgi:hypothetical protein
MKTVSQCREQAGGCKIGTVFEVKKEIPVKAFVIQSRVLVILK